MHRPGEGIDIDIDLESEIASVPLGDSSGENSNDNEAIVPTYLALDTNILVARLALVKILHDRLQGSHNYLLVPTIVIAELDGLTSSIAPNTHVTSSVDVTVGESSRSATSWLLETSRARRAGRSTRVIFQRWTDRPDVDQQVKPDDRVLECCLYFARGARVLLWTDDRNLSLLAEANGIPTLGGRVGIARLSRELGVLEAGDEEGMEVDAELLEDDSFPLLVHDGPSRTYNQSHFSHTIPNNQGQGVAYEASSNEISSGPSTLASAIARSARSKTQFPLDLLHDLADILLPVYVLLTGGDASLSFTSATELLDGIERVLTPLIAIGTPTSTPPKYGIVAARAVAAIKTISAFLGPGPQRGERRTRSGDAADAIDILARSLLELGVELDEGEVESRKWKRLEAQVRALP